MAAEDLVPTSDIVTGFTLYGGSTHYGNTDEGYSSATMGSGEEVYSDYAVTTIDELGLGNTVSMGSGDETSQIEIMLYCGYVEAEYQSDVSARLYIDSGYETPAESATTITHDYNTPGWYTFTFTGTWTKTQVDAAQAEFTFYDAESSSLDSMGAMVVRVTYEAAGGDVDNTSFIAATLKMRANLNNRLRRM